jgi:hypothetical protein
MKYTIYHLSHALSSSNYAHYALLAAFIHFHMSITQLLFLLGFYYLSLAFYMCVGVKHFYD